MEGLKQMLLEVVFVAFILSVILLMQRRAQAILKKWADANGFQIVSTKRHTFRTGPFKWWTNRRSQIVYSFTALDRDGHERTGWARLGSDSGGTLFSDQIEIRWD